MLCIYHIADHDGKGSAAVVKSVYPDTEFFGLNHDMEIPYDEIRKHDKIVVCDIALPLDFMFELSETKDFTWIDHHLSVIKEYEDAVAAGKKRVTFRGSDLHIDSFTPLGAVVEGMIVSLEYSDAD